MQLKYKCTCKNKLDEYMYLNERDKQIIDGMMVTQYKIKPNVHISLCTQGGSPVNSVPARPISEGAAPGPYWLAPCPN